MADKKTDSPGKKQTQTRQDRLKAALKANLGRRKIQARARTGTQQEKNGKD